MYSLQWRSQALPWIQKQTLIAVPTGAVVSNASSLRFTGKGASNYGKIQQENLMRLLENFAGPTEPPFATVGETWFDTSVNTLKVCVSTAPSPVTWKSVGGTQITEVGDGPPTPATLGDTWFQKTGSSSGVLYVYTGVGRYPQQVWNASTYFPSANTGTLAFKPNFSTFGVANFNEMYISGYTGASPADVNGTILVGSTSTTVPKGVMFTNLPSNNAFVVWDTTSTLVSQTSGSGQFFQVRQPGDGTWQYDNDLAWITFSPQSGMYAVGTVTVAEIDDDNAPGITAATPWVSASQLSSMSQVPNTLANGAIGGWEQIFPTIERAAGREEYEYLFSLVSNLLGDPSFGGSGVLGRSISYLTNFQTLDASLVLAARARTPVDLNLLGTSVPESYLKVEPNSNDWDALLAAAKYAISRLELPPGYVNNVSQYPFVNDGRQASAILQAFPIQDVQRPGQDRLAGRKPGSITLHRAFNETVNALNSAIQNRYILKGMMGTSGVNTTFGSTIAITQMGPTFSYSGTFTGGGVTHGIQYKFDFNGYDIERFFASGQALEIILKHPGTSTASDVDLKAIADGKGRFRVTADAVYVMDSSNTPALAIAPITGKGYLQIATGTTSLAVITSGTATVTLRAAYGINNPGDFTFLTLYLDISTTGSTSGATTIACNYIGDSQTYPAPAVTKVYTAPLAYVGTDKTGPFA